MKCPDRKGLVRSIADFISSNGGNILHADHHIDFETHYFFSRVEWEIDEFTIPKKLPRRSGRLPRPTLWNGNCASPTSIRR
jgi:formyltetrahydrofolate deformylase